MASGINVKVSTKKLIKAMEEKVAEHKKLITQFDAAQKKYDAAVEKHEAFLLATAPKLAAKFDQKPLVRVSKVGWGANSGKTEVEVSYYIPNDEAKALNRPDWDDFKPDSGLCVNSLKEQVQELNNAIRLLGMSDEEFVNTSTYKSVAKYL